MTKAREIAELGQKLTVDASGNIDVAGTITADSATVEGDLNVEANNPRIRFEDADTDNNGEITLDNTSIRIEADEDNLVDNSRIVFRVDGELAATITDNGRLGVGHDTPSGLVHIVEGGTKAGGDVNTNADTLIVENNANAGLTIKTPAANTGRIAFGDPNDNNVGQILYDHTDDEMHLSAGAQTVLTLIDDEVFLRKPTRILGTTTAGPTLRIESSGDNDSNVGPQIEIFSNTSSPATGDNMGQFDWRGTNSTGTEISYARMFGEMGNVTAGAENGSIRTVVKNAGSDVSDMFATAGFTTFNYGQGDRNFSVRSSNDSNAFFVDGANGRVGVGTNAPTGLVHILGSSPTKPLLLLQGGSNTAGDLAAPAGQILQVGHWDDGTATFTNRLNIDTNGDVGLSTISSPSTATSGAGHFFGNTGYAVHARERSDVNHNILILNDTGNIDGALIDIRRNGVTSGKIGHANLGQNRNLFVGHGDTALSFQGYADNAITPFNTSTLGNRDGQIDLGTGGSKFNAVWTNSIRTSNNVLTISVDDDASGSNQAIYFREGGVTRMSLEDNDVYVSDNIFSGLRYEAGGSNRAYDTTSSHISAYAANSSSPDDAGFVNYRTFIQAYNTTDPDVAVFQAFSKDVMADTGGTSHNEKATAHLLDNGGRVWSWNSHYVGRTRVGTTATSTAYRAGDSAFTAYSGTGNSHGAGSYAGFTQIVGRESANADDVFLVSAGGQHRIEFDASGNGYFDGGADMGAADYAEYFEWQDGNPNNEDRRGHSVVLNSDGTIRIATASDPVDDIIGIVSVEAAVVGDSAWAAWTGKHERDRFGQTVYEDYDLLCWGPYDEDSKSYKTQTTRQAMIDAGREDDIPEDAITVTKQRKKLAADYDPDREYIPRKDRQEWVAIGLMGKLPLLKGQPTGPRWRKLFDLNDEVEMWLVR